MIVLALVSLAFALLAHEQSNPTPRALCQIGCAAFAVLTFAAILS